MKMFNYKTKEWFFILISVISYIFYIYFFEKNFSIHLNKLVILNENKQIISDWLFWAIAQMQVAWFPVFLFIASFWKGSVFKRTLLIYPGGCVIGNLGLDFILSFLMEIYTKELDNGKLFRTVVNSPQASLLVIIIILLLVSLYYVFVKKRKIFWFSTLTMLAFLLMNIIYHVGLINGTLIDTVNNINYKQQKLTMETNSGADHEKLTQICNFEKWKCITFEIEDNDKLSFTEKFKGYIGNDGIDFLKKNYDIKFKQHHKEGFTHYFFRRNFSVPRDDTAYVGFTEVKYNNKTDKYNGILIIDAVYFQKYFILADVYLTKMLIFGNLFWVIMIIFIVQYHEKFLNRK